MGKKKRNAQIASLGTLMLGIAALITAIGSLFKN